MEIFSVNHIDLCVNYDNGLSYKDPIKMFRMRQEFAKRFSMEMFNKEYSDLNWEEKFNITYMVTNTNLNVSIKDFILESGFRNLHKNQKEDMWNYRKLDFLNNKFQINKNEFIDIGKKRIEIIKKVLYEKLDLNFVYRIYNQSIKSPKLEPTISDIKKFNILFNNGQNISTIIKLRNKLFTQRECVSACIIMNAQRYCYCDLDDYWDTMKREIRDLKRNCGNYQLMELKYRIQNTFKNYFAITPYYKTRPLDKRVNRNFINKEVYDRIRPLNATVEKLNKFGKKLYENI